RACDASLEIDRRAEIDLEGVDRGKSEDEGGERRVAVVRRGIGELRFQADARTIGIGGVERQAPELFVAGRSVELTPTGVHALESDADAGHRMVDSCRDDPPVIARPRGGRGIASLEVVDVVGAGGAESPLSDADLEAALIPGGLVAVVAAGRRVHGE